MAARAPIPTERLRVVQVIPILITGGLERVATMLTIGLRDRVERVVVCSRGGEPFEPALRAAGVEIDLMPRAKAAWPGRSLRAALVVAGVLRRERPHVVHAHNPVAAAVATVARRLARLPDVAIVTTYHGVMPERVSRAASAMARSSDIVVGVGPTSTRALHRAGLPDGRGTTVPNAVAVEPGLAEAAVRAEFDAVDAELVVSVGRLVEEKNHALLLEAIDLLRRRRPGLRAAIVGAGPLAADLRAQATSLGLDDTVVFAGERFDAPAITAAGNAFALSSASEGLPVALLEALALGTAVVATDVGGVSDAIVDGETGLLVPPFDAAALAGGLERVLDDGPLRERLVAGGRAFVDRTCSPEAMIESYIAVYHDAVERRLSRRSGASPST